MPRKPRHFLANVACHIISRGNNHNVCFFADDDYLFYLECLSDACVKYAVSINGVRDVDFQQSMGSETLIF
ncbi:hypothetical protein [Colwellia sp. MB02u-11]|uniref:hypothetical protein n=1 Tax=Colwellia sp. MB02u-11 TaxID=2759816 RepID=UPI0015F6E0F4|nr:hypothetical protein [Colwellia sp. MB02u-11]MBA6236125.1 hypothetical protein [Colwellia sp. MB02u-11]